MGTSEIRSLADSLQGWGRQPLVESAQAYSCPIVSICALSSILSNACVFLCRVSRVCAATQRVTLHEDVVRREANHANNERWHAQR
jgi:hypothetical protein